MESEKVKEIKKALECCKENEDTNSLAYCYRCPFGGHVSCEQELYQKSLTLINELESENERLRKERDKYIIENKDIEESNTYANKFLEKYKEENQQLKDQIAELEKQICRNEDLHTATEKLNDTIILKQFAERLKEDFTKKKNKLIKEREIAVKYDDFILIDALAYKIDELQYAIDKIDETLKEFINEKI